MCTKSFKVFKNGIYSIALYTYNKCIKFQANMLMFGCAMAQKSYKGGGVTFFKHIFWAFLIVVHVKTSDVFLGILRQYWTR